MDENDLGPQRLNQFGKDWEVHHAPVTAIVGVVDDSGENIPDPRIGLSAMQLKNLDLEPLDNKSQGQNDTLWLKRAVVRNTEGLTDDREYPMVLVGFKGKQVSSRVYNAFGHLAMEGSNVRVSRKLIEDLGASIGSELKIDRLIDSQLLGSNS